MLRLISYVCAVLAMVLGTAALSANAIPLFLAFATIELVLWKRLHVPARSKEAWVCR